MPLMIIAGGGFVMAECAKACGFELPPQGQKLKIKEKSKLILNAKTELNST